MEINEKEKDYEIKLDSNLKKSIDDSVKNNQKPLFDIRWILSLAAIEEDENQLKEIDKCISNHKHIQKIYTKNISDDNAYWYLSTQNKINSNFQTVLNILIHKTSAINNNFISVNQINDIIENSKHDPISDGILYNILSDMDEMGILRKNAKGYFGLREKTEDSIDDLQLGDTTINDKGILR